MAERVGFKGSALTEYAFPLALVACACIVAITLLGSSAKDALLSMGNSIASKPVVIAGADEAQAPEPQAVSQAALTASDISSLRKATEKYIPSFNDTVNALDSTGANGATTELASSIEALVPVWKAQGAITQEQADMLLSLARQGYRVAASQKNLETAFARGDSTVTEDGVQYSLKDAIESHGFKNTYNSWDESKDNVTSLNSERASSVLKPLLALFGQALEARAMDNPVVKDTVTKLVQRIAAADDSLSWSVDSLSNEEAQRATGNKTDVLNQAVSNNFKNLTDTDATSSASMMTQDNSDAICQNSRTGQCSTQ